MHALTATWFAQLATIRGCRSESVTLESGETLAALYARLIPEPRRVPVRFAVDDVWATGDTPARPGTVVLFLPPVGGG